MLDQQLISKIESFVHNKPRSIQEVAEHIGKNWRTADRYIDEIEKNFGTVSTRVFRGGTRGALKIAYWASIEKVSSSVSQDRLEHEISVCKRKEDFSTFDIFQYVPSKNREIIVRTSEEDNIEEYSKIILGAKKQVLFFSGNLSFVNLKGKKNGLSMVFEELAERGVTMKVLCRVDLAGKDNIESMLSLNSRQGKNAVEIRHDAHPIRGVIIDGKVAMLKEVKEPTGKINELDKKVFIFYSIDDKSWVDWLSRLFWKKFSNSIDANRRLEHLKQIRL